MSSSSYSSPKHNQPLNCHCGIKAATFISEKPKSKGRLFHTCSNYASGGCNFFMWANVHEIVAQSAFPGMMRRIDSLMAENLSINEKLKEVAIGEEKFVEMAEVLKKEIMHMSEEISKLRQLKVVLVIIIILSWAPTIFKWMG